MSELISCISDYLGVPETELSEDTDLQNDLGLSSFDLMDLSCEIEEHFNIRFETEMLANIRYIKDINKMIPSLKQA